MKEAIEKYLKAIGAPAEHIAALKADETPEEYNHDDAVAAFNAKRKDLFLNNSDMMKELKQKFNKEQFPAIVKPLQKAIKDATGLTADEITGLIDDGEKYPDTKKLITAGINKMKASGASSVDEVQAKLNNLQKQYDEAINSHKTQIDDLKTGFQRERKQEKVKSAFNKIVTGLDLIMPNDGANTLLSAALLDKYNFDVDDNGLNVTNKDGTKVSRNNDFVTAEQLIKMQAEEYQIIKKSNGGGTGTNGIDSNPAMNNNGKMSEKVNKGELSPAAKAMQDRMKNQQK